MSSFKNAPLDAQHLLEGVFVAVTHLKLVPGIPKGPAAADVKQQTRQSARRVRAPSPTYSG
jgi:hypothetical protein